MRIFSSISASDIFPPLPAVGLCAGTFRVTGNAGIAPLDDLAAALSLVSGDVAEELTLRLPSQKPAPSIANDSTQERTKPFLITSAILMRRREKSSENVAIVRLESAGLSSSLEAHSCILLSAVCLCQEQWPNTY